MSFLEDLDHVLADIMKMGESVQNTLKDSISSLKNKDADMARHIIGSDDIIDNQQIVIEESVVELLRQQPSLNSDLRRITAFVKIATDLERIGDYASNIAEIALELRGEEYIKPLVHIPQASDIAVSMVKASLEAFVNSDTGLAEAVCKKDDELDDIYRYIYEELDARMTKDHKSDVARQALRLIRVAEYIERVGDHATNIAEQTIYINTGKRVKY